MGARKTIGSFDKDGNNVPEAIDSGKAQTKLDALIEFTQQAA